MDSSYKHESCQVLLLWLAFCLVGHSFKILDCELHSTIYIDWSNLIPPIQFGKHAGYKIARHWRDTQNGVLKPFPNIFKLQQLEIGFLKAYWLLLFKKCTFLWTLQLQRVLTCATVKTHFTHFAHMLIVHEQLTKKFDQTTLTTTLCKALQKFQHFVSFYFLT